MIYYRTYKYLIKPTALQKEKIKKTLEYCTFVYNKFFEDYGDCDKHLNAKELLEGLRSKYPILLEADTSPLMNLLFKLQDNNIRVSISKKKKGLISSYTTTNLKGRQAIYVVDDNYINVPGLGNVKTVMHRSLPNDINIINATITRDNLNDYYICISFKKENIINNNIDINRCIGLDYSQENLYVDSNGKVAKINHNYKNNLDRIAKLKTALSKCRKGSKKYYELKDKIGKIYKRTTNKRNDYLHKLSKELASEYDIVCVEDIDMIEIAKQYNLAKNTYDNSYGRFLEYLKYKLEDNGKVLIKVNKYFPSSKKCNVCGYIYNNLRLSERTWICPQCKTKHDRDINAAINIKNKGLEEFTSIGYLDQAYKIGSIPH